MELVVRPARPNDAEGIARVPEAASAGSFHELVGKPFAEVFPLDSRVRTLRQTIAGEAAGTHVLVAETGGRIVGMAVWSRGDGKDGELVDLHVVPELWGSGVAKDLIDAAVAGLREAGVEDAFLWVGEANPRARRFYEREGWRFDGTSRPSALGPTELRYRLALSRQSRSE